MCAEKSIPWSRTARGGSPLKLVAGLGLALALGGCSTVGLVSQRTEGYVIPDSALAQVSPGQSVDLVVAVLGSPQTTSTFGERSAFYYVETKVERTSFGMRIPQATAGAGGLFRQEQQGARQGAARARGRQGRRYRHPSHPVLRRGPHLRRVDPVVVLTLRTLASSTRLAPGSAPGASLGNTILSLAMQLFPIVVSVACGGAAVLGSCGVAYRPWPNLPGTRVPMCPHRPVLLAEVLDALAPISGARIVDGTFGAGGYSRALLERGARSPPSTATPASRPYAAALAGRIPERFIFRPGRFSALDDLAAERGGRRRARYRRVLDADRRGRRAAFPSCATGRSTCA